MRACVCAKVCVVGSGGGVVRWGCRRRRPRLFLGGDGKVDCSGGCRRRDFQMLCHHGRNARLVFSANPDRLLLLDLFCHVFMSWNHGRLTTAVPRMREGCLVSIGWRRSPRDESRQRTGHTATRPCDSEASVIPPHGLEAEAFVARPGRLPQLSKDTQVNSREHCRVISVAKPLHAPGGFCLLSLIRQAHRQSSRVSPSPASRQLLQSTAPGPASPSHRRHLRPQQREQGC